MDFGEDLAAAWSTLTADDVSGGVAQLDDLADRVAPHLLRSDDSLDDDLVTQFLDIGYFALQVAALPIVRRVADAVTAAATTSTERDREVPSALEALCGAAHLISWSSYLNCDPGPGIAAVELARGQVDRWSDRGEDGDPFVGAGLDAAEESLLAMQYEGDVDASKLGRIRHAAKRTGGALAVAARQRARRREPPVRIGDFGESTVAFEAIVAMRDDPARFFQLASEAYDLQQEASAATARGEGLAAFQLSCTARDIRRAQLRAFPGSVLSSRQLCHVLLWQSELLYDLLRPTSAIKVNEELHLAATAELERYPELPCALVDATNASASRLTRWDLPLREGRVAPYVLLIRALHDKVPGRQPQLLSAVSCLLQEGLHAEGAHDDASAKEQFGLAAALIEAQRTATPRDPAIPLASKLLRAVERFAKTPVSGSASQGPNSNAERAASKR